MCNCTELDVELMDPAQVPIAQKPYNHSTNDIRFMQSEVKGLLEADLIESTRSPWASPVVVAKRRVHGEL